MVKVAGSTLGTPQPGAGGTAMRLGRCTQTDAAFVGASWAAAASVEHDPARLAVAASEGPATAILGVAAVRRDRNILGSALEGPRLAIHPDQPIVQVSGHQHPAGTGGQPGEGHPHPVDTGDQSGERLCVGLIHAHPGVAVEGRVFAAAANSG
jgi:hypothetical protein